MRHSTERADELVASWWQEQRHRHYEDLNLRTTLKRSLELALLGLAYHRSMVDRTEHGDFAKYFEIFKHENIDGKCECGRKRRPRHFAECRPTLQHWRNSRREPPPKASEILAENR